MINIEDIILVIVTGVEVERLLLSEAPNPESEQRIQDCVVFVDALSQEL